MMQQTARRVERAVRATPGGHLRVVAPVTSPRRTGSRGRSVEARCRSMFNTAVVVIVVLAALGLMRVAILAQATEMTLSADRLTRSIKQARLETDRLEIDRSSLSTPSRIAEIASASMFMGHPSSVSYISLPGEKRDARALETDPGGSGGPELSESASVSDPETGLAGIMDALVDMTAGEAQTLLVGDLGLAGSR